MHAAQVGVGSIANLFTQVGVADGTQLTRQGRPGMEFFLVVDGEARCLIDGGLVRTPPSSTDWLESSPSISQKIRGAAAERERPREPVTQDWAVWRSGSGVGPTYRVYF